MTGRVALMDGISLFYSMLVSHSSSSSLASLEIAVMFLVSLPIFIIPSVPATKKSLKTQ